MKTLIGFMTHLPGLAGINLEEFAGYMTIRFYIKFFIELIGDVPPQTSEAGFHITPDEHGIKSANTNASYCWHAHSPFSRIRTSG
jgi:hypothetical protein